MAADLLGHTSLRTTTSHYIQATGMTAHHRMQEMITRRRTTPPPPTPGKPTPKQPAKLPDAS